MRNSVGYLMRVCTNRLLPQMEALFKDQELTFSQWTTLVALHERAHYDCGRSCPQYLP